MPTHTLLDALQLTLRLFSEPIEQNYLQQLDSNLQPRISSLGMGESQLLSEGDSDQDHQLNRRVELELLEQ